MLNSLSGNMTSQTSTHPSMTYETGPCEYLDFGLCCERQQFNKHIPHRQPLSISNFYYASKPKIESLNPEPMSLLQSSNCPPMKPSTNRVFYTPYTSQEYLCDNPFKHLTTQTYSNVLSDSQTSDNMGYYTETLEPRKMVQDYTSYAHLDFAPQQTLDTSSLEWTYDTFHDDCHSPPYQPATYLAQELVAEDKSSPNDGDQSPSSSPSKPVDGDVDTTDKPYAKLIYEALMKTEGHKMMLREIYEWFSQNTTKPQESGTNGWQNSIRHNLSMNQAFENDKSSSSPEKGHSRKANSVWTLTEHAVKHGVQSTTRYRKPGHVRRGGVGTSAAVQRQRSGAKGGRATRRNTARLRKHEEESKMAESPSPTDTISCSHLGGMDLGDSVAERAPQWQCQLASPAADNGYDVMYGLPIMSDAFEAEHASKIDHYNLFEDDVLNGEYVHDLAASPNLDRNTQD